MSAKGADQMSVKDQRALLEINLKLAKLLEYLRSLGKGGGGVAGHA